MRITTEQYPCNMNLFDCNASHSAFNRTADIWAIGCLFCEMATGRPLFPGRDTLDQLWQTMRAVGPLPLWQMQLLKQQDVKLANCNIPSPSELRPLEKRSAILHAFWYCLFGFGTCRLTLVSKV